MQNLRLLPLLLQEASTCGGRARVCQTLLRVACCRTLSVLLCNPFDLAQAELHKRERPASEWRPQTTQHSMKIVSPTRRQSQTSSAACAPGKKTGGLLRPAHMPPLLTRRPRTYAWSMPSHFHASLPPA